MPYLADTVTVIRHFTDSGKIGGRARHILEQIEANHDSLVISVISLMEIMYLSDKHRIDITLSETFRTIESSSNYTVADLTPEILQTAQTVIFNELHDRLILSTAKFLGIAIISSDENFKDVPGVEVIWD